MTNKGKFQSENNVERENIIIDPKKDYEHLIKHINNQVKTEGKIINPLSIET